MNSYISGSYPRRDASLASLLSAAAENAKTNLREDNAGFSSVECVSYNPGESATFQVVELVRDDGGDWHGLLGHVTRWEYYVTATWSSGPTGSVEIRREDYQTDL
jgi:hypothetical protein